MDRGSLEEEEGKWLSQEASHLFTRLAHVNSRRWHQWLRQRRRPFIDAAPLSPRRLKSFADLASDDLEPLTVKLIIRRLSCPGRQDMTKENPDY